MLKYAETVLVDERVLPKYEIDTLSKDVLKLVKRHSRKAFTLAEVLITLTILGVVAAITIPSTINRQSEVAARTKLKKAVSTYENMAAIYMAETGSSNLSSLSCDDLNKYFKTVKHNGCDFVTADGVAWHWNQANSTAMAVDTAKAGQARFAVFMWANGDNVNTNGAGFIPSAIDTTLYTGASLSQKGEIYDANSFISGADANPGVDNASGPHNVSNISGGGSPSYAHVCGIKNGREVYCYYQGQWCLVKGTMITMADGSQCPIENIHEGDMVLSVNPSTWEIEPTRVTISDSNMVKFADHSDKWYFDDGTIIETAHRHRFYCAETNSVKYLDEWEIGYHTYKLDGTSPKLVKHEVIDGDVQHFTLFTENQTYFANNLMSGNRNTLSFGERTSKSEESLLVTV